MPKHYIFYSIRLTFIYLTSCNAATIWFRCGISPVRSCFREQRERRIIRPQTTRLGPRDLGHDAEQIGVGDIVQRFQRAEDGLNRGRVSSFWGAFLLRMFGELCRRFC